MPWYAWSKLLDIISPWTANLIVETDRHSMLFQHTLSRVGNDTNELKNTGQPQLDSLTLYDRLTLVFLVLMILNVLVTVGLMNCFVLALCTVL